MMIVTILVLILASNGVFSLPPELVDLATPLREIGEGCGYDACPTTRPGALNVHVVPHTHYELGHIRNFDQHFTGTDSVFARSSMNMKRTLDYVITELWSQRHRTFALSDFPYFFHWWSKRDNTVRRMVYELIRQGRLNFIGGGWSMSDEATTSYHAIIESHTYTLRKINATFLSCGRPLVSWQADVKGHSREFANLVALMGYDALFVHPISFDDELARMSRWALEMLWRGSDDIGPQSDMFTHKLFDGYWSPPGFCFSTVCDDPLIITSDNLFANAKDRAKEFRDSMLTRQGPNYNTSHVLVMMGKVYGYHDAAIWFANIDKLIGEVNQMGDTQSYGVFMSYSSPACYVKAVHEANPKLETKQDDFFPVAYDKTSYLTGSYSTHPPLKLMAREALVYLQMAKQMQVLARLYDNSQIFESLNWILGAFQDHMIMNGVMLDDVKSYYTHRMYVTVQRSTLLLKQAFNKIRKSPTGTIYYRCSLNISSCHTMRSKHSFIVVYNPLAWPVTMPIRIPVTVDAEIRVYLPNGNRQNTVILRTSDHVQKIKYRSMIAEHELVFLAEDLPPLGFRSYFIEKYYGRKKRTVIKNMKRKNNKKYLIRQTNTAKDDQGLLNDLDDYEYEEDVNAILTSSHAIQPDDALRPTTQSTTHASATKAVVSHTSSTEAVVSLTSSTEAVVSHTSSTVTEGITVSNNTVTQEFEYSTDNHLDLLDDDKKKLWSEYVSHIKKNENGSYTKDAAMPKTEYDEYVEEFKSILAEAEAHAASNETSGQDDYYDGDDDENETTVKERPTISPATVATKPPKVVTFHPVFTEPKASEPKDEEAKFKDDDIKTAETKSDEPVSKDGLESSRRFFQEDRYLRTEDLYIENKYIRINLNPSSHKISDVTLANGIHVNLDIQFYFYIADDPDRLKKDGVKKPGAFIFRPMDSSPVPILDHLITKIYKTELLEEVHISYAEWASVVVRLYVDSAVIEVDWVIGPVPLYDGIGKEIFIRYMTDLANDGAFYTDSNGRQTVKRIRDLRPMYESLNLDMVGGNYYPVTSKIYIEDLRKNIRFSIFNDRAQGGTSLYDGEIDLMIQRRLLTHDMDIPNFQNDTEYGTGVTVRGKHYLYFSKGDHKPNKIFEKKFAKEVELMPQILVSPPNPYGDESKSLWEEHINEVSFLKNKMPIGIHLLTLETWNDGTILLRLENYLEKADIKGTGIKRVFLRDLFTSIRILSVKETTLGGNIFLKDYVKMTWMKKEDFVKSFNGFYGTDKKVEFLRDEKYPGYEKVNIDRGIALSPQQIRTFVCDFVYI